MTFSPPDDRESLRTYAELMTMFDNPKFPDQLSALGGDTENYRLPWEKAAWRNPGTRHTSAAGAGPSRMAEAARVWAQAYALGAW